MSALQHLPLSPVADVPDAVSPHLSSGGLLSLAGLARDARRPLALVLFGATTLTVTILSGLVDALLNAPPMPSF